MSTRARILIQIGGSWRTGSAAHLMVEQNFEKYCLPIAAPSSVLTRWQRTLEMWKQLPLPKKQIYLIREPRARKPQKSRYVKASRYIGIGRDWGQQNRMNAMERDILTGEAPRRNNGQRNAGRQAPVGRAVVAQQRGRDWWNPPAAQPPRAQHGIERQDWVVEAEPRFEDLFVRPEEAPPPVAPAAQFGQRVRIGRDWMEYRGGLEGWRRVDEE